MTGRSLITAVVILFTVSGAAPVRGQTPASDPGASLYQRLGGYDRLAAVVDDFFGRFGSDPELTPFLGGINASEGARIRQHLIDFVCAETGGPCAYHGRNMRAAHEGMGITQQHFDRALVHFAAALREQQVPQDAAADFMTMLRGQRSDIVQP
jgi:hemoglobin